MSSQDFLSLAYAVVARHYQDPDFNVETFARYMGISRVHLCRRLKELTQRNASAFLREQRLKIAAQRLQADPDASVTEIAYDAGFGSHAYFTKCFGEHFNQAPKQYRKGA